MIARRSLALPTRCGYGYGYRYRYSSLAYATGHHAASPTDMILTIKYCIDTDRNTEAWTSFQNLVSQTASPIGSAAKKEAIPPTALDTQDLNHLLDAVVAGRIHIAQDQRRFSIEQIFSMCNTQPIIGYSVDTDKHVEMSNSILAKPRADSNIIHTLLRARAAAVTPSPTPSLFSAAVKTTTTVSDVIDLVQTAAKTDVPLDETIIAIELLRAIAAAGVEPEDIYNTGIITTINKTTDVVAIRTQTLGRLEEFVAWVKSGKQVSHGGLLWVRDLCRLHGVNFPRSLHPPLFTPSELRQPPPLPKTAPPALRARRTVWAKALRAMRAGIYPGARTDIAAAFAAAADGLATAGDVDGVDAVVAKYNDVSSSMSLEAAAKKMLISEEETSSISAATIQMNLAQMRAHAHSSGPSAFATCQKIRIDATSAASTTATTVNSALLVGEIRAAVYLQRVDDALAALAELRDVLKGGPTAEALSLAVRVYAMAAAASTDSGAAEKARDAWAAAVTCQRVTDAVASASTSTESVKDTGLQMTLTVHAPHAKDLASATAAAVASAGATPEVASDVERHLLAWDSLAADSGADISAFEVALIGMVGFAACGKADVVKALLAKARERRRYEDREEVEEEAVGRAVVELGSTGNWTAALELAKEVKSGSRASQLINSWVKSVGR